MRIKFRSIEFNAKTLTYGRNNKPAEADFLGTDSDSQDGKLDNMDFHVEGYIYGKKVEETKIKLEKALEKRQGLLVMPDGRSAQVKIEEGWHITKSEEADDKYNLDFSFKKIDSDSLSLKIIELQELDDEKFTKATAEAEKAFWPSLTRSLPLKAFPGLSNCKVMTTLSA